MTILYEGKLKQNNDPFHVTLLSLEHMEQILSLQNVVVEALEDKGRLQPLSLEEFQYILEGNGMMIGAFIQNELIAFRALLVPPIDDEHLGLDIGLPESRATPRHLSRNLKRSSKLPRKWYAKNISHSHHG